MIFSFKTGHFAKKILFVDSLIYNLTERNGSLDSKKSETVDVLKCRISICLELITISKKYKINDTYLIDRIVEKWIKILFHNPFTFIKWL